MNKNIDSNFNLIHQTGFYQGKVRDVYYIGEKYLMMVASDRISAFDVVLPKPIPYKGAVLSQLAAYFLEHTADIVPNWLVEQPHPQVSFGFKCQPIMVEVVVRAYLAGHAWRLYKQGNRSICGVNLPDGMREFQQFEKPIITPTTKATNGHDLDISEQAIIELGLVEANLWNKICNTALALFERGSQMAHQKGLILVDTKYEFGLFEGELMLMDEIHTPDSSRYVNANTYKHHFENDLKQEQLSKEFVREWLIENNFMGRPTDVVPMMNQDFIEKVSDKYINLYEKLTGIPFQKDFQHLDKEELNKFLMHKITVFS